MRDGLYSTKYCQFHSSNGQYLLIIIATYPRSGINVSSGWRCIEGVAKEIDSIVYYICCVQ